MTQENSAPSTSEPTAPATRTWRCKTCQYLLDSPTLPFRCPRCGASRVKLQDVTPRAAAATPPPPA